MMISRLSRACLPPLCLAIGLLGWSLWRVPIPGVNEPHYLSKAKHFWNPQWMSSDMFLASSNPHSVFYLTFGWLTQIATLETTAILGRCAGLVLLAIGWQRLCAAVTGSRWGGLLALPVFLTLQSLGNWSGEWVVGGIEAKVPSYGFLFWALGCWLNGKWIPAAALAGLSVSFHPIVGIWGAIAWGMATCWIHGFRRAPMNDRPTPQGIFIAAVLFFLCALPGLVPAVAMIQGADSQSARAATILQVAHRLSHHLDPMDFSREGYRYFGLLIVFWIVLKGPLKRTSSQSWWDAFVVSTLVIALAGVLLGWGPRPMTSMPGYAWRALLLKFYPFRLADLMVPIAVSLVVAERSLNWRSRQTRGARATWALACFACGLYLFSIWIPSRDQNPSNLPPGRRVAWIETLTWVRENTPKDSLIYAANEDWAVKWFARRPEYVNYKDVPQDAASMVEWNRRLWVIARWKEKAVADNAVSVSELEELGGKTGIRYLIASRLGQLVTAEPVHENGPFRVYSLEH